MSICSGEEGQSISTISQIAERGRELIHEIVITIVCADIYDELKRAMGYTIRDSSSRAISAVYAGNERKINSGSAKMKKLP